MEEALRPLGGHAVFLLLVQMAVLLIVARLGAEAAKRVGLPAVVGELAAGIVLGPTVFGHYAPAVFAHVFPHETAQFNLLEVVGTLGMVLLLLLTGLETDLRLLKNLGRAALIASATGMALPFATGFFLGTMIPASYLAQPDHRILFSLFLATAMSISAMPVIAKILMDLDLTKRNIGLVILSAGVVDDTAGWLILSLIAGAASSGTVHVGGLLTTILYTALFLLGAGLILWPLLRIAMAIANRHFQTHDADLVVILVATFLCAALTEKIGIHAVFGAFICGTVVRQAPRVSQETIHRLESFVFAILSPIFFGIVGLKVNLWALGGGGGKMLAVVLTVACVGKLVGCTLGGIWGGMRFWEAVAIAIAMNARGAMELVLATIGLSLGILNQQMFSIMTRPSASSPSNPKACSIRRGCGSSCRRRAGRTRSARRGWRSAWPSARRTRSCSCTSTRSRAGGSASSGCSTVAARRPARASTSICRRSPRSPTARARPTFARSPAATSPPASARKRPKATT
jgi:Kef-type K+ transport system membrane component KefB